MRSLSEISKQKGDKKTGLFSKKERKKPSIKVIDGVDLPSPISQVLADVAESSGVGYAWDRQRALLRRRRTVLEASKDQLHPFAPLTQSHRLYT